MATRTAVENGWRARFGRNGLWIEVLTFKRDGKWWTAVRSDGRYQEQSVESEKLARDISDDMWEAYRALEGERPPSFELNEFLTGQLIKETVSGFFRVRL